MHASLKNYRQSPRKTRLVADLIKGQSVSHAYALLEHTPKRATDQIKKLLKSAVANAKQESSVHEKDLFVKEIRVDDGQTMKRYRPVSRGRAHPIRKRTSNISLVLMHKDVVETKEKKSKSRSKTTASKV